MADARPNNSVLYRPYAVRMKEMLGGANLGYCGDSNQAYISFDNPDKGMPFFDYLSTRPNLYHIYSKADEPVIRFAVKMKVVNATLSHVLVLANITEKMVQVIGGNNE